MVAIREEYNTLQSHLGSFIGLYACYMSMVEVNNIEIGATYKFVIEQGGNKYEAVIDMDTMMDSTTHTAVGMVQESTYPTDGWEGEQFRIHRDGTVSIPNDPFSPVGEVVEFEQID